MTLIKKTNPFNKSVTAANLLSMALIMSTVSCGCGDDKDEKGGKLEFTLTSSGDVKPKETDNSFDIKFKVKVTEGELATDKFTAELDSPPHKLKSDKDKKSLKELGITDPIKKGEEKEVTMTITGNTPNDNLITNDNQLKENKELDIKVKVKGKVKGDDGKEADKEVPVTIKVKIIK